MSSSPDDVVVRTASDYERNAAGWSRASGDRRAWAPSYDSFRALLAPGATVLDLGCGSGHDAPALAGRGLSLTGLDVSVALLQIAASTALRGRLVRGDLRSLPFVSGAFAALWLDGTLHHVRKSDVPAALAGCARVLKPGGLLFAAVERGAGEGFVHSGASKFDSPRWYALYELAELHALLTAADFDLIDHTMGDPGPSSDHGFVSVFARRQ